MTRIHDVSVAPTWRGARRPGRDAACWAIVPAIWAALPPVSSAGGRWVIGLAGVLAGLIAFALLAVIEYGAWALVVPPRDSRKQSEGEPVDAGSPIHAVAADGVRLAGRFLPATGGGATGRTALLLHGFAESSNGLQAERTAALRRAGWNVAALDLRGYGESGGLVASFGGREAGDVSTWLDVLGAGGPLTPVLWGHSMGAAIALRAASRDERIRALVLESPMLDLDDAMTVWFRKRRFPLPGVMARLVTRRASSLAGISLTRPTAIEVAPQVRCPVLILHGREDTLVRLDEVRRLVAAFPKPARLIEVPGAGHADVVAIGGDSLAGEIFGFLDASVPA